MRVTEQFSALFNKNQESLTFEQGLSPRAISEFNIATFIDTFRRDRFFKSALLHQISVVQEAIAFNRQAETSTSIVPLDEQSKQRLFEFMV